MVHTNERVKMTAPDVKQEDEGAPAAAAAEFKPTLWTVSGDGGADRGDASSGSVDNVPGPSSPTRKHENISLIDSTTLFTSTRAEQACNLCCFKNHLVFLVHRIHFQLPRCIIQWRETYHC